MVHHDRSPVALEQRNFYAADFNTILGMLPNPSITQRATGLPVAGSSFQVNARVGRCRPEAVLDSLTKPCALTCSAVSCSFNSCLPPQCAAADIPPCAGTDCPAIPCQYFDVVVPTDETVPKKIIELARLQNWLPRKSSTQIENAAIL